MKPIQFPQDELAHNHIIEWWYFNGQVKDRSGNAYAFMHSLFKADPKRVKIPFLRNIPLPTVYFAHSILCDLKNRKTSVTVDPVTVISTDSFSKKLLYVNYTNPILLGGYVHSAIEEKKKFEYHMKNAYVDLHLKSKKKPLLDGGAGYVKLGSKRSYYYSLTNLAVKGILRLKNKDIAVTGKAWMDHQWANESHSKDKWTWFSLQLDGNTEIMCFEYDEDMKKTYLASMSYPNNKQESCTDVKLTPLRIKWTSPRTKAQYPLSWRIEIPSKQIRLETVPLMKKQEIIFGTMNYWEGPLQVRGFMRNKKVKGVGFMELVGYPSSYSKMQYARDEVKGLITKSLPAIRSMLRKKRRSR